MTYYVSVKTLATIVTSNIAVFGRLTLVYLPSTRYPLPSQSPPPPPFTFRFSVPSVQGVSALASSFTTSSYASCKGVLAANRPSASQRLFSPSTPQARWVSAGVAIRMRGGGEPNPGPAAAASSAASSTMKAPVGPVEKFRKDYVEPGHWTRYKTYTILLLCCIALQGPTGAGLST